MADEPFLDEPLDRFPSRNVLGGTLEPCSRDPLTGFYRTGCCDTGAQDAGAHVVCVLVTDEFLEFSVAMGNDLVTPMPAFGFPGLVAGNRWCLCAARWKEALAAGVAPPVVLAATHERALEIVSLAELAEYAIDVS
jgi:uncharacterized protein (DUF2237 family)